MTIPAEQKPSRGIGTLPVRGFLLGGIALMIGGELLCFFGAEAHARSRDVICHIIFYSGAAFILGAVIFYFAGRR
jgi:membrane protein DedA with SNARE-associated domain